MTAPELEASPADWDSRALCPDDSCIGVLDAQGRCTTCGLQGEALSERQISSRLDVGDEDAATHDDPHVTAGAAASSISQDGDAEFADRQLCPDESCIGLLDDAGACKVCGKRL